MQPVITILPTWQITCDALRIPVLNVQAPHGTVTVRG